MITIWVDMSTTQAPIIIFIMYHFIIIIISIIISSFIKIDHGHSIVSYMYM